MTTNIKKASIIDFWHAVELFSPQTVPRLAPRDTIEPVFLADEDLPLPWEPTHFLKRHEDSSQIRRRHFVYCGIYQLDKIREILEEQFGKQAETHEEYPSGESCLFTFSVTQEGRPLFETFTISSCAWATGRTLSPGPHDSQWLKGFKRRADELRPKFEERLTVLQNDEQGKKLRVQGFKVGRPIKYSDIVKETEYLAKELGVDSLFEGSFEIRIKSTHVSSKKEYPVDDQDFLNSFFLNDLKKVSKEVRQENFGRGLRLFLLDENEIDISKRIDIKNNSDCLPMELSPSFFSAGKWPGKDHHPLVFSQQLAVNYTINTLLEKPGLFSINGPPGTGKTTLLKDLIAAIVVERAHRLSHYSSPLDAFEGSKKWQTGEFTQDISLWKEELKGFEIVVASSNNTAVENVTLEIPNKDTIDPSWLRECSYFPELATSLIGQPAWSLIAARLGNKLNRQEFLHQFWYADTSKKSRLNKPITANGLLVLLKDYENETVDWEKALNRFKEALKEEEQIRDERIKINNDYEEVESLKNEIFHLEKDLQKVCDEHTQYGNNLNSFQERLLEFKSHLVDLENERIKHHHFFPRLLEIIFSWGKAFKEWKTADLNLKNKVAQVKLQLREGEHSLRKAEQEASKIEQQLQEGQDKVEAKKKKKELREGEMHVGMSVLGKHFPFLNKSEATDSERELSSPWADPIWNKARAKVFIEALNLHKTFIMANAPLLRKNLHACMDILSGSVPETASIEAIEAAWATLFFFVPVISTTFASFDRLFGHLGRERLGWLLIDEAGQALPHAAVGAIWRTKRTVVVGDRMQLEPVVTCPLSVQEALRLHYNTSATWIPSSGSVQKLADRASERGTYIRTPEDEAIWVGSPLRVHRRCDKTIFNISNQIAYGGLMVFGTPHRTNLNFPPSAWIDVKDNESDGHWVPAEGRAVLNLIDILLRKGAPTQTIFLISPFRRVVKQLKQITKKYAGIKSGTIHTVQGKETDIVILVLGGDLQKQGAKKWASARPNLLNVATSRAKRRLYVIGNRELWGKYQYFKTLKSLLPEENITDCKIAI